MTSPKPSKMKVYRKNAKTFGEQIRRAYSRKPKQMKSVKAYLIVGKPRLDLTKPLPVFESLFVALRRVDRNPEQLTAYPVLISPLSPKSKGKAKKTKKT